MQKNNIIAHRGFWDDNRAQNSIEAFTAALDNGFGIETDLRDCLGEIVISHDIPLDEKCLTLNQFFKLLQCYTEKGRIALNIKADGLHDLLQVELNEAIGLDQSAYVFDMSVPDAFGYKKRNIAMYGRISDVESQLVFSSYVTGIWVDDFSGNFDQLGSAKAGLENGYRVCLVSPELHGRHHLNFWSEIKHLNLHTYDTFELCTDFPADAYNFFKGSRYD